MIWAIFKAMADSTPQNRSDSFKTTRWTLVSEAGNPQDPLHDQALDHLLCLYRPALWSHLVKRWRIPPQQADDLLQDFILRKILQYNLIQHADRACGKFRTLLLTSLDNFARDATAKSQGPGDFPKGFEPVATAVDIDREFHIPWARQVLQESLRRMEQECRHGESLGSLGYF